VQPLTDTLEADNDAGAHESGEPGAERRPRSATLRNLPDSELAQLVERSITNDRKFFVRHPHRKYRVRRASAAEVEQLARRRAQDLEPPPKMRWFICTHRVHERLRARILFAARRLPPGASARAIWEAAASPRVKDIVEAARERGTS
jgi:hypothetical protein